MRQARGNLRRWAFVTGALLGVVTPVVLEAQVDSSLTIVGVPAAPAVGVAGNYTLHAVAGGGTNIKTTTVFSPAVTFNSGTGCSANSISGDPATTVICSWANADIVMTVTPLTGGRLDIAAGVVSSELDTSMTNNSQITFVTVGGTPVTISSLTPNVTPQSVGQTITWTATASGGTPPLQYRFWRLDSGQWVIVRDYNGVNTFTWTPIYSDVGDHSVIVWVKSANSTASWDAWTQTPIFTINGAATVTSLTNNTPTPRVGVPMTWTATATGSPTPLQYRFWRLDGSTWVIVRDFTTANTWTWTPVAGDVGSHAVIVWVKVAGSANPYDTWYQSPSFTVAP